MLAADAPLGAGRDADLRSSLFGAIGFGVVGTRAARGERRRMPSTRPAPSSARARRCSSRACVSSRSCCGAPRDGRSSGHGWWPVSRLGLRNATDRPGRSVLAIAVIASATFILISVDAFRRDGPVRRPIAARAPAATRCSSICWCRSSTIPTAARGARRWASRRRGRRDRAVPRAAGRRCELPEPVRADEPAILAPRPRSSTRAASRFRARSPGERRRARESVAAAGSQTSARAGRSFR